MHIEDQIRNYIIENLLFGEEEGLTASQSLLETGVVDSTGVVELVAFLEKNFALEVADEDLAPENLDTIAAIAAFVRRKQAPCAADVTATDKGGQ